MKATKAKKKNLPKLKLADLLRRRKMTLKQLLDEFGITTYSALTIRCDRMGVTPPSQSEFEAVVGPTIVSSPTEGVVVLPPPPVIEDLTGKTIEEPDQPAYASVDFNAAFNIDSPVGEEPPVVQKKKRKKDFSKESSDE